MEVGEAAAVLVAETREGGLGRNGLSSVFGPQQKKAQVERETARLLRKYSGTVYKNSSEYEPDLPSQRSLIFTPKLIIFSNERH